MLDQPLADQLAENMRTGVDELRDFDGKIPDGSIVAFGAYLTLLGRIGANRAGYAMVMFPVVAMVLSVLFEGLAIDTTTVVGLLFVLAGNLFVLKTRRPNAMEPTTSSSCPELEPQALSSN